MDDQFHLQLQADNGESPLILLELGGKEWKRLEPNAIFVSNAYRHLPEKKYVNKTTMFSKNMVFGQHIAATKNNVTQKTLVMKDDSSSFKASIINIQDIKKGTIAFVTTRDEIMKLFSNFIGITSNATPASKNNTLFNGSGMILLSLIKHDRLKSPENECNWDSSLLSKLQKTKPNICVNNQLNNHFGSQGYSKKAEKN